MVDYLRQRLGNYRLVKLLGEGGFAEVYLGKHVYLDTYAAVKVLTTKLTDEGTALFQDEARTIARLIHPHIVRLLDFGVEDKIPFLVMDYAPHGSLRQLHPRGTRLPLQTTITYVKQIADALQYVHNQKLIHRDIKPDNMLIGRNNEVLLSDFGITAISHSTHSLYTHNVSGTIHYMAPEQIQGKPRPASDQYALGVVVYEWLCGVRLFNGTPMEIGMQHLLATPLSLREKVPSLPLGVEQTVLKVLAKDPHQRFANVQEFSTALEEAYQIISSHEVSSTSLVTPTQTTKPDIVPPYVNANKMWDVGTWQVLHTMGHRREVEAMAISEDEQMLVSCSRDHTIKVWNVRTGRPLHTLTEHTNWVLTVALTKDGQRLASAGHDQMIRIWDVATWQPLHILNGHTSRIFSVAFTRDGRTLVSSNGDETRVWDVERGQLIGIMNCTAYAIVLSRDGQTLFNQDGMWDIETGQLIRPLTGQGHTGPIVAIAVSEDEQTIVTGSRDHTIKVWKVDTGQLLRTITGHRHIVWSVALSRDGQTLASGSEDQTIKIWRVGTGQLLHTLTGHTSVVRSLIFSKDGRMLVSGGWDLMIKIWGKK